MTQVQSSETKSKKPTPSPSAALAGTAEKTSGVTGQRIESAVTVALTEIAPSKTNPRKTFTNLDELAASIKSEGVLVPLIIRANPEHAKDRKALAFELVDGERRLRASKMAGLQSVPVLIKNLGDAEALDVQIIANVQREDVQPLEEAEGYQVLVDRFAGLGVLDPVDAVAKRVGKTRVHILRRLQLVKLPELAKKKLASGEIGLDVAALIARIPNEKLREGATKEALKPRSTDVASEKEGYKEEKLAPSAAVVRRIIEEQFTCRLEEAPFDPKDADLVAAAGACGPCPKRTGSQSDLFGDVGKQICTDPVCFQEKAKAAFEARAKTAAAEGKKVLAPEVCEEMFRYTDEPRDGTYIKPSSDLWIGGNYKKASTIVGKEKLAVYVAINPETGKAFELFKKSDVERLQKQKAAPAEKAAKTKAAAQKEKSKEEDAVATELAKRCFMKAVELVGKSGLTEVKFLRAVIQVFENAYNQHEVPSQFLKDHKFKNVNALLETSKVGELRAALLAMAVGDLGVEWNAEENAAALGRALGLDLKKLEGEVKKERAAAAQTKAVKK